MTLPELVEVSPSITDDGSIVVGGGQGAGACHIAAGGFCAVRHGADWVGVGGWGSIVVGWGQVGNLLLTRCQYRALRRSTTCGPGAPPVPCPCPLPPRPAPNPAGRHAREQRICAGHGERPAPAHADRSAWQRPGRHAARCVSVCVCVCACASVLPLPESLWFIPKVL